MRHKYIAATGDSELLNQRKSPLRRLTSFTGDKTPVVGCVDLSIARYDKKSCILCHLVEGKQFRAILGKTDSIALGVVKRVDTDAQRMPSSMTSHILSVAAPLLTMEDLLRDFSDVFASKVGKLQGQYSIAIDETVRPVQHAPRRVPAPLRDQLKATLADMAADSIITPVTEPTPWISSLVIVPKKSGKLRLCLDPKDLNRAIKRENYPLPTIEEIATRLNGARIFTVLDVMSGFWHVELDEQSSRLTTFHTPFGRYRWLRMPFGISSASEVFQRKMHELIEGLEDIEVIADDFVVCGKGKTDEEAKISHDKNLIAFLQRCRQKNVVLGKDKVRLRQREANFIGHIATPDGLNVAPERVKALLRMPEPTDVNAVRRFIGFTQYLAKFMPHLADELRPLTLLTKKDTLWHWQAEQQTAFEKIKHLASKAPVFRYYSAADDVTIQCDSSKDGLGATLLQLGQPVCFASRALTDAESRYAQIEKELLAIVFACEKFDCYIYGRNMINVESDHKPLEAIFKKPLSDAPKRLQRMLMRLQRYRLSVTYKPGKELFLADTLSRAYLRNEMQISTVELEEINHREHMRICEDTWKRIETATASDSDLPVVRQLICDGWPEKRDDCPVCAQPYFNERQCLTIQGNLIFRGSQVVIPSSMRREMMCVTHKSHMGIEACLKRMRESLYWPQMSAAMKDYVAQCDVCVRYQRAPDREPMISHDIPDLPWMKIAADLCDFDGRILLVIVDYYSNYVEVESVKSATSANVIKVFHAMFARWGIAQELVTDNGPQFASQEFARFTEHWGVKHITSSLHYPQSNGKAERAVGVIKDLFRKCKASGVSEAEALLDYRNTPNDTGMSPAQLIMGRRCRTSLVTSKELLIPLHHDETIHQNKLYSQQRARKYYNRRGCKPRAELFPGQDVTIQLPGKTIWTRGVCLERVARRSYNVQVGNTVYRRTSRHIRAAAKPQSTSGTKRVTF
jgi:transposase InsO family protein